ncbi:MAG TPA: hypothetical protein VKZ92_02880 [Pseudohongiella sp.]|nr:hypothetical protein [Pseudohongiella sp.]
MSGYLINARLHDGKPVLEVVDAQSQEVCLSWDCPSVHEVSTHDVQSLFRQLMLLSCRQSLLR